MERFDIIAIGGGTAGLVTAAGAANLGLRAALVEREVLGGDCLWTGCVPSKALIASGRAAHTIDRAAALGLRVKAPAIDAGAVLERMRQARAAAARPDDPERFRKMGVEVVFGAARFAARDRIDVAGRWLEAPRMVVATGARPAVPPIPGLEDAGYLTHLTVFDLETLPRRLVVIGGGPVGLELAQTYQRLGTAVTVLETLPRVLPHEDPEAADVLANTLRAEGVDLRTGRAVERVEGGPGSARRIHTKDGDGNPEVIETDEVLVATGRKPHTAGLNLEAIGVRLEGGAVLVDGALRASVPGIWAAGDVAGGPQFTHVADYHAKLVLRNAVFPFSRRVDYSAVPAVTYTDPEVARIGLTEEQARARHGAVHVYRYDLADLDRAIVDAATTGFVKVVTRGGGRILGATVVARGGGETIVPLALAMRHKLGLPALSQLVYPYPTMAEGVKRAADAYYRRKLAGGAGRWLRRVVSWLT
jgi:pyruvate/2-oxoglutarate dehydrogenase complex dihydrolipoamide dehydrogenase (E3) component